MPQGTASHQGESTSQPAAKRVKRAQYAPRACDQCQRRKVKCDGRIPCQTCLRKGRDCQRQGEDRRGRWRTSDAAPQALSRNDISSRLTRLERQLNFMNSPRSQSSKGRRITQRGANKSHGQETRVSNDGREMSLSNSSPSSEVPTFSGETSIAHNLTVVEGRLEQMGVEYLRQRSTSPTRPFRSNLTPSPESSSRVLPGKGENLIQRVLRNHGIIPDCRQWEVILHTFCDEVHVLVPFLHLPSIWRLYEKIWTLSFEQKSGDFPKTAFERFQAAHVLLCLANGKCVESSRFEEDEVQYSAGWSFYSAAREIFGDLLDGFSQNINQIFLLQTVVLMVIYLFRLDAHGPAEKVLALSISHAHHLGLQRNKVVESMTLFEGEQSRRLWWCIYLLDRRLAIETGRPFLIQDVNVDVGLPCDISDEMLDRQRVPSESTTGDEGPAEAPTMVPYLIAMTTYSRVIGKVWEALYGAATSEKAPTALLNEYLAHLITHSQRCIQPEFSYDPLDARRYDATELAWWQVKQQFIMRIRWSSIYLLIRKPMLHKAMPLDQPEMIENEVVCMHLAQRIIDDFKNVPEEHPKYTFPFLHYLTNATIIALGLIIKQPSFKDSYGEFTLEAAKSLKEHCRKTWMSGKMIQTVQKLQKMADAILLNNDQDSGDATSLQRLSASFPSRESQKGHSPDQLRRSITLPPNDMSVPLGTKAKRPYLNTGDVDNVQPSSQIGLVANLQREGFVVPEFSNRPGTGGAPYHSSDTVNVLETVPPETIPVRHLGTPGFDTNPSFPGEMIDDRMEWLQSLFANGFDPTGPPAWH